MTGHGDDAAQPMLSRAAICATLHSADFDQLHGVPRGVPDQVQGPHLPDPQRGHLGLRPPRGQAAQAVRRVAPCSTAARASTTATSSSSATSGTTSIRSSSSRRSSTRSSTRYYREHPDERRFIGPSASLDDLLAELGLIRELLTSGARALGHPAVQPAQEPQRDQGRARGACRSRPRARMIREVDQLLETVFASSKFG